LKDDEMLDRNVAEQVVRRKRNRPDPAELQKRITGSVVEEYEG